MRDRMCMPGTDELEARIAILIALSQVYAAGGENLDQSLPLLTQAFSRWVDEMKIEGTDSTLKKWMKAFDPTTKTELAFEYNRLFVGPASPSAPPYESVYRSDDRLVMQETTLDVRKWYNAENLRSSNPSNEPDDFIATELEFAAYLLSCALELCQQNRASQASDYLQKYNTFWRGHFGLWLPAFVRALSSSTQSLVFQVMGDIVILTVTPISQRKGGLS